MQNDKIILKEVVTDYQITINETYEIICKLLDMYEKAKENTKIKHDLHDDISKMSFTLINLNRMLRDENFGIKQFYKIKK